MFNESNNFYKMDLHHHTKKVHEENEYRELKESQFEEFFKLLKKNNVRVVSFTNHNFIDFDQFTLFQEFVKTKNFNLLVLIGIELKFKDKLGNKQDMEISFSPLQLSEIKDWYNDFFKNYDNYNEKNTEQYFSNPKSWKEIISNEKFKILKKIVLLPNSDKGPNGRGKCITSDEFEEIISFSKETDKMGIYAYEAVNFWKAVRNNVYLDRNLDIPIIAGSDNRNKISESNFDNVNVLPFLPNNFDSIFEYLNNENFKFRDTYENKIIDLVKNPDNVTFDFFQNIHTFEFKVKDNKNKIIDKTIFPIEYGINLILGEIATGKTEATNNLYKEFCNKKNIKLFSSIYEENDFNDLIDKTDKRIREKDSLKEPLEFNLDELNLSFSKPNLQVLDYISKLKKFKDREQRKKDSDWKDLFLDISNKIRQNPELSSHFLSEKEYLANQKWLGGILSQFEEFKKIQFESIVNKMEEGALLYPEKNQLLKHVEEMNKFIEFFSKNKYKLFWNYKKKKWLSDLFDNSLNKAIEKIEKMTTVVAEPAFDNKILKLFNYKKNFIDFFHSLADFYKNQVIPLQPIEKMAQIDSQNSKIFYRKRHFNFLGESKEPNYWNNKHGNMSFDLYNEFGSISKIKLFKKEKFILSSKELLDYKIEKISVLEKSFLDKLKDRGFQSDNKKIRFSNLLIMESQIIDENNKPTLPSGGQKHIILLKESVNSDCDVLILDEPERSLDNLTFTKDVIKEISRVNLEKTVMILISHNSNLYFELKPNNIIFRKYNALEMKYETYLSSYHNNEFVDINGQIEPLSKKVDLLNRMEGGKEVFDKKKTFYNENAK